MKGFAAAFVLVAAAPAPAAPLIVDHGRLFVAAQVNGIATEALLDSAAEASLIDPALARRAKLPEGQALTIRGSGGTAAARAVEGVTIATLRVILHPEAVVVTDLSELSKRLIKRPTQAVIGRELFDATRLRIDIGRRLIEIADATRTPPGRRLALTAHAGVEAISVRVDGRTAKAEFDLGNGSGILISRRLAKRLGLAIKGREAGGGIGGSVMRDQVILTRLDVAGTRFRNLRASIDDQSNASDLNIGTAILKRFLITTDFRQRAVWMQPIGRDQ